MKLFISVMASIAMLGSANAASILQNCAAAKSAGFFANDLESIAQEGKTPVLLFNDKDEVVGLLTVAPERAKADPHDAKKVVIKKIAMCAPFMSGKTRDKLPSLRKSARKSRTPLAPKSTSKPTMS